MRAFVGTMTYAEYLLQKYFIGSVSFPHRSSNDAIKLFIITPYLNGPFRSTRQCCCVCFVNELSKMLTYYLCTSTYRRLQFYFCFLYCKPHLSDACLRSPDIESLLVSIDWNGMFVCIFFIIQLNSALLNVSGFGALLNGK